MRLNPEEFLQVIKLTPLFSIDLVVVNEGKELLIGKRVNAPAKSWWFVPGGRVFKNESLNDAFSRISISELGKEIDINKCKLLGVFEHFYDDCALNNDVDTHYINTPYLMEVEKDTIDAPELQHDSYRWVSIDNVAADETIHEYSKVFLSALYASLRSN